MKFWEGFWCGANVVAGLNLVFGGEPLWWLGLANFVVATWFYSEAKNETN